MTGALRGSGSHVPYRTIWLCCGSAAVERDLSSPFALGQCFPKPDGCGHMGSPCWRPGMAPDDGRPRWPERAGERSHRVQCHLQAEPRGGAARAKGVTPESTLSAFRQAVARRTPVSPGPAFKLAFASASSGAIIDFPTLTFAARNAGEIRVVVMADRWFGDVELFVEAECPPTSQGLNGLLDLLQRATVNQ